MVDACIQTSRWHAMLRGKGIDQTISRIYNSFILQGVVHGCFMLAESVVES